MRRYFGADSPQRGEWSEMNRRAYRTTQHLEGGWITLPFGGSQSAAGRLVGGLGEHGALRCR
jgi:hypothetical protein